MSRVRIADLKARLREHLTKVRGGEILTVLDGETVLARIVPHEAEEPLQVRRATRKPGDLRLSPPPADQTDSLAVLLQDRAST